MVETPTRVTRAERKDWARETFRGAESMLLPSFTPDFSALDEEGIRHDVRNAIAQGFFSVLLTGVGATPEERMQMLRIAIDEADGRVGVSSGAGGAKSLADAIADAQELERIGCQHLMLSLPRGLNAQETYDYSRQLMEATDLGFVFYAVSGNAYKHLDVSNIPLDVYDRLSDLPNAVGMKITQVLDPVTTLQLCERLGDKILLGPVNLEMAPIMAKLCQVQFTCMWAADSVQAPEKPFVVDFMNLLGRGRIQEAVNLYYQFQPLIELFWDTQAPLLKNGIHPWAHIKYSSWVAGGNGGLLRPGKGEGPESFPATDAAARQLIRDTFESVGVSARGNEEEAWVGRAAFARGVRSGDLATNSTYV